MDTKATLHRFDQELEAIHQKIAETELKHDEARAEHSALDGQAMNLRKLQKDAQIAKAMGDPVDECQYDAATGAAFELERAAYQKLSILEEACQGLRGRLRDKQAERLAFVNKHLPAAYQEQLENINGSLRALMGKAVICYSKANSLPCGMISEEKLLRIMSRGQGPLDLAEAEQAMAEVVGR